MTDEEVDDLIRVAEQERALRRSEAARVRDDLFDELADVAQGKPPSRQLLDLIAEPKVAEFLRRRIFVDPEREQRAIDRRQALIDQGMRFYREYRDEQRSAKSAVAALAEHFGWSTGAAPKRLNIKQAAVDFDLLTEGTPQSDEGAPQSDVAALANHFSCSEEAAQKISEGLSRQEAIRLLVKRHGLTGHNPTTEASMLKQLQRYRSDLHRARKRLLPYRDSALVRFELEMLPRLDRLS